MVLVNIDPFKMLNTGFISRFFSRSRQSRTSAVTNMSLVEYSEKLHCYPNSQFPFLRTSPTIS